MENKGQFEIIINVLVSFYTPFEYLYYGSTTTKTITDLLRRQNLTL